MRNGYGQRAMIKLGAIAVVLLFWQTTDTSVSETEPVETSSNAVQMLVEATDSSVESASLDTVPAKPVEPGKALGTDACAHCDGQACGQSAELAQRAPGEHSDCPAL
jgi:hypothetical protein